MYIMLGIGVAFLLGGCALPPRKAGVPPRPATPRIIQPVRADKGASAGEAGGKPTMRTPSPRQVASLQLVVLAWKNIDAGHLDMAISLLERAVALDGYNGRAYYALAQAWSRKGELRRALAFLEKAELFLQGDVKTLKNVYLLEAALYEKMGNHVKADAYRVKASHLP